jgi:hypothetical protein
MFPVYQDEPLASGLSIASKAAGSGVSRKNEASASSTRATACSASEAPRSVTCSLLAWVPAAGHLQWITGAIMEAR